jgi:hypothetical protein
MVLESEVEVIKRKIPEEFIYEIMDGKPIYYKGYKEAIKNHLTAEEIMGCSSLQSELVVFILKTILRIPNEIPCSYKRVRLAISLQRYACRRHFGL